MPVFFETESKERSGGCVGVEKERRREGLERERAGCVLYVLANRTLLFVSLLSEKREREKK